MRSYTLAALAAAFVLPLAACGNGDSMSTASGAGAAASASPGHSMGEFGPACSAVPKDASDPGSFSAMAKAPVATAAAGNPMLKTLVSAVTKASLGGSLNSAPAITVFAPSNDAFAKIPPSDLDKVLADEMHLSDLLKYHVVAGRLAPDKLAGTHRTLQGGSLEVTGSGEHYTVNGTAAVVCGNVQTANATVYIVDTVLMPKA